MGHVVATLPLTSDTFDVLFVLVESSPDLLTNSVALSSAVPVLDENLGY